MGIRRVRPGGPRYPVSAPSRTQLAEMSQVELDEHLDTLVRAGRDDSPEFHAAYREWERQEG